MGIMEIVLLLLGIVIFVASFIIPERRGRSEAVDRKLEEEQIKELAEKQMTQIQEKLSGAVEETISYAMEKTERSLERITNEKIMAVNEYSDTVLTQIHKNHEETVFLYDMLNDKHQDLKETAAELAQNTKAAKASKKPVKEAEKKAEKEKEDKTGIEKAKSPEAAEKKAVQTETKDAVQKEPDTKEKQPQAKDMDTLQAVNISFAPDAEEGRNSNERILALHKEGKSNMAIAKELGLGIGEVKLVIDLFKGG